MPPETEHVALALKEPEGQGENEGVGNVSREASPD